MEAKSSSKHTPAPADHHNGHPLARVRCPRGHGEGHGMWNGRCRWCGCTQGQLDFAIDYEARAAIAKASA